VNPNPVSAAVIFKFGGTSVADPAVWRLIAAQTSACLAAGGQPVVVLSALAGVTDRLQQAAAGGADRDAVVGALESCHRALADAFEIDAERVLADEWRHLKTLFAAAASDPAWQAEVLACGEWLSSRLGTAILRRLGIAAVWHDSRTLLTTVETADPRRRYLNAECAPQPAADARCAPWLAAGAVPVTQGFIAATADGQTTVLGRGGSDTSAAYLAVTLGAARVEIWTDVPGLFSAPPQDLPGARQLRHLGYREAQEIAANGAKVLHPRCLLPLARAGIPLTVKSTRMPEMPGTEISHEARDYGAQVKAVCSRRGILLISLETLGMWQQVGFLAEAFAIIARCGFSIDLISTSESNVTLTLDPAAHAADPAVLEEMRQALAAICNVRFVPDCVSVSLVGRGIRSILHRLGPALEVFQERRILLVSQAANDLNLSFVVEREHAATLVHQLHELLIPRATRLPEESVFGPAWRELHGAAPAPAGERAWWRARRAELLQLAARHPAAYVYHLPTVRERARRLAGLRSIDRVLYALKANTAPAVLAGLRAAGLGFDCVSRAEVEHLHALFPDLAAGEILFTPNFAPRDEYQAVLDRGHPVTIDNLEILENWPALWAGREIFLRFDPGQGHGHHQKVKTAGVHSKFGIPLAAAARAKALCAQLGASVSGLHIHIGSGLMLADNWRRNLALLLDLAADFPALRVLDLGGGLGVPGLPGEDELDLAAFDRVLGEVLAARQPAARRYEIWLEPGRYLTAESGVLLVTVTQTKDKGQVVYVGVNAGMNALLRPALYGAYHEIVNLSRLDDPVQHLVNVVGPICETGDVLGYDRMLPPCREGDVLLIANGGAYGAVMASHYNLRTPPPELILDDDRESA